jgi:Lrp/AsnC family transcriptional regulator for asnA, asnC and gidA
MRHQALDELDEQILKMVVDNARIPFLEVARACNISGAAVHQRIHKLRDMGVLKGSKFIVDPESMGFETCAFIGIYLKNPEVFDEVAKEVAAIPEVVECHCTTGKYDMFIKVYARNNHHLMSIIHEKLQSIGVARTETLISFNQSFQRQIPITRNVDDEDVDNNKGYSSTVIEEMDSTL